MERKGNKLCGIFGGSSKEGQQLNLWKLKILGICNDDRGGDSCGYYYNGNIERGIDTYGTDGVKEAKFIDFVSNNGLVRGELDMQNEVFLGHTRKGTVGSHTIDNAHPFEVGDYVQTHNGTISNIKDLTKKYEIDEDFNVDSKGLAALICKVGFKVLEEYAGYAALAMTSRKHPERLYLYQGAAKQIKSDKVVYFERPLFFLEQPEGIYYSSLADSLAIISETDDKPQRLIHNTVVEIRNGEFTDYEFKIFRDDANLKPDVVTKAKETIVRYFPPSSVKSPLMDDNSYDMIKRDTVDINSLQKDIVYVQYGRYYVNNRLMEGRYEIDRSRRILKEGSNSAYTSDIYYFIKGVMIRDKYEYERGLEIVNSGTDSDKYNVAAALSRFSKYPVFCLPTEGGNIEPKYKNKWYMSGNIINYNREFTFKFSGRSYNIKRGITAEIKKLQDNN